MQQLGSIRNAGPGQATWTLRNERAGVVSLHLEPEGDQIDLPPGSTIVVRVTGGTMPTSGNQPLEVSTDGRVVTIWSTWPGSSVKVTVDGEPR